VSPDPEAPAPVETVREMGVTHAEFFRSLPPALGDAGHRIDGTLIRVSLPPGRLEIRLGPEGVRRIASLSLPRTVVTLRFENLERDAVDAFLLRFERAFQRGGG